MTNEPKVGELPALLPCPFCGTHPSIGPKRPDLEGNAWAFVQCEDACCFAQPRVESHEESGEDCAALNRRDAIVKWNTRAEREARKDEARAVELLRRLVWTHVQGINTHDAAIESMDAWRDAKAYVAALQAEQPESP